MDYEQAITFDVEQLTAGFVALRNKVQDEQKALDEKMKPFREQMEVFRTALQAKLHEAGANSMKTASGTPYLTSKSAWKVVDWEEFFSFVNETQEPDFLVKNVSGTAADAWLEKTGKMPPGLEMKKVETLNVRT